MSPPTPLFLRLQTQNPLTLSRIVRTVESPPGPPHHYITSDQCNGLLVRLDFDKSGCHALPD
ncbi:hypothetical protein BS47DRAFT_1348316, partial [Hydnum rufescens UP504]